MFYQKNSSLVREYAGERLVVQLWGKDSLRVRSTMRPEFENEDWALLSGPWIESADILIANDGSASITHGRITARIDPRGQIAFLNHKGEPLLQEFIRHALAICRQ